MRSKIVAGYYAQSLEEVYNRLFMHLKNWDVPEHRLIQNLLSKEFPKRKEITPCDIFNTRVRTKEYLKKSLK